MFSIYISYTTTKCTIDLFIFSSILFSTQSNPFQLSHIYRSIIVFGFDIMVFFFFFRCHEYDERNWCPINVFLLFYKLAHSIRLHIMVTNIGIWMTQCSQLNWLMGCDMNWYFRWNHFLSKKRTMTKFRINTAKLE